MSTGQETKTRHVLGYRHLNKIFIILTIFAIVILTLSLISNDPIFCNFKLWDSMYKLKTKSYILDEILETEIGFENENNVKEIINKNSYPKNSNKILFLSISVTILSAIVILLYYTSNSDLNGGGIGDTSTLHLQIVSNVQGPFTPNTLDSVNRELLDIAAKESANIEV